MFNNQNDTEVELIRSKIDELPAGSKSYKTIKGKRQPYLQWTQDGRTRSRYLAPGCDKAHP